MGRPRLGQQKVIYEHGVQPEQKSAYSLRLLFQERTPVFVFGFRNSIEATDGKS
jgi:hypothetical protein